MAGGLLAGIGLGVEQSDPHCVHQFQVEFDQLEIVVAAALLALNAGATIYVSGIAATLADGVAMAEDALASGLAAEKLKQFIDFTQLMRSQS